MVRQHAGLGGTLRRGPREGMPIFAGSAWCAYGGVGPPFMDQQFLKMLWTQIAKPCTLATRICPAQRAVAQHPQSMARSSFLPRASTKSPGCANTINGALV